MSSSQWTLAAGPRRATVLLEDVELLAVVPEPRRADATRASVATALTAPAGRWDARAGGAVAVGGHGMLLLDGLLVRRVGLGTRIGAELLGPGDVLRPFEGEGDDATLPFEATWRAVTAVRVALLDRRWTYRMAAFPDVGAALTGRALARSIRLADTLAIAQHPRLDARLHLVLWELADRFGRVGADGVHLRLPLTHDLLAHLCAARRPSVSSALARLGDAGLVRRDAVGWVLHGDPPDRSTWDPAHADRRQGATGPA